MDRVGVAVKESMVDGKEGKQIEGLAIRALPRIRSMLARINWGGSEFGCDRVARYRTGGGGDETIHAGSP